MKTTKIRLIFFDSAGVRPYDCALMLNAPLPKQLDVRKLAVKGVEISANVPVSSLPRIAGLLVDEGSSIMVDLRFYIDDERFKRVDGHINSLVSVVCQRCLEPVEITLDTQFELAVVWSEEDAQRLPKSLEPLIIGEELTDLSDVVSEELILSLPFVSYHKPEDCQQEQGYSSVDPDADVEVVEEPRENPFNILAGLKVDK